MPGSEGHGTAEVDVLERGANEQAMDRRLFMQLVAFRARGSLSGAQAIELAAAALAKSGASAVIYEDVNDPSGFAVLAWSEKPSDFVDKVRPALDSPEAIKHLPELAMLGRTYSSGYEDNLAFWLLERPVATARNEAWPWAVWYPLRRSGAFARLPGKEQAGILREHAAIGRAYGEKDLAHDIRLACHGLDRNDNEFVIGLVGKELHPLSHVVQTMRKTRQTSEYIVQMGPFFVGRRVWRSP